MGSFKEVKDAIRQLPSDSTLRKLVLLEPDDLPVAQGLPKCVAFVELLYAERKKSRK